MSATAVVDPYANREHRKGCMCGRAECQIKRDNIDFGLDLDAAFRADACRSCTFWKRRDRRFGTCWHHDYPAPLTHQNDNCEFHGARFIHVATAS